MAGSRPTIPELLTVDEYLERERVSEIRHDHVAGHRIPRPALLMRHNLVVSRLLMHLLNATKGLDREVFTSQFLIRAGEDLFYYPDISVVLDVHDGHEYYSDRPCLLVEVLSPHTVDRDRHEKLVVYRNIPSLRGYMMVEQDFPYVELHERTDGDWQVRQLRADDVIDVPCLPLELPVNEIYAGVPDIE